MVHENDTARHYQMMCGLGVSRNIQVEDTAGTLPVNTQSYVLDIRGHSRHLWWRGHGGVASGHLLCIPFSRQCGGDGLYLHKSPGEDRVTVL